MTTKILVDTDVLVDFLRGNPVAVSFVQANAARMVLSSVTIAELYAGSREGDGLALDELPRVFPVEPVTFDIARAAGLLKANYGKSHGLGLADALVAATARHHGFGFATLNVKHFPMFPGMTPPYRK